MKYFVVIFILFIFSKTDVSGQFRNRNKRQWPKTEGELMNKLLGTLQNRDTAAYFELFPPFDTLWSMVMRNNDKNPETQRELSNLKERPQILIEFDPLYNRDIIGRFCRVLAKGEDSGVQWRSIVMARYELRRQDPTRNLIGYDRIAPDRFRGYMFVSDAFNRVTYCITVSEVQKIKGQFFGGQVLNILEAKTVDEFNRKEAQEQAYFEWLAAHPITESDSAKTDTTAINDSLAAVNPLLIEREEETDDDGVRREVVERRYYEGTLDNEIPIRFYIRHMKQIPGKPPQYDGLYKLGENRKYMRLEISRNEDGKLIIEDESATGTMELTLTGRTYTGTWANADENGFDVILKQTGTPKGKIEMLDKILDRGASGRIDERQFETEDSTDKAGTKGGAKKDGENKKKKDRKKKKKKRGE